MACPTSVSYTTTTIPCYAAPYATSMLGKTQALTCTTQNPYMKYLGCTVAQFTPLEQQAFTAQAAQQVAPQLKCATTMAGNAGLAGLNTRYAYNPYQAQQVGTGNFTDPNTAMAYMNPYLQASLAPQIQLMQQQQAQQQQMNQASAVGQGAFGGTRCAVLTGAQNQANQLAQQNLIGNAFNQAYKCAEAQYSTCAARNLQAQTTNQAANQTAANLNAQQQQFGANLGLQGLNLANTAAGTLNTLGNSQFTQGENLINNQEQLGAVQQQQVQNVLNQQYQCYLNAKNYPYEQLSYESNILHGLPMTNTTAQTYQAPPSMLSQVAGLGLGVAGLSSLGGSTTTSNKKKGGAIKHRKSNGIVDLAIAKMG